MPLIKIKEGVFMNKKLKKMLVAVSAVAMCTISAVSISAGAAYVPIDEKITPYTTSFTCEGEKYHLCQELNDYYNNTYFEAWKIYISDEPFIDSGETPKYNLMAGLQYVKEESEKIGEPGIFVFGGYSSNNSEDIALLEDCLSNYNIKYESYLYEYTGYTMIIPLWGDLMNSKEQFEILQNIKNETGFVISCGTSDSLKVTDVENTLPEPTLTGDVNEDGNITIADSVLILQSLSNPDDYKLTIQGIANADMDGDGVTAADALKIQEMLANK